VVSTRQPSTLEPALVGATAAAVSRWGLTQVTVERIAAEAGLSRATLHRRGLTREVLVAALAQRVAEQFRAAQWPALTGQGSAAERLQAALEATFAVADEHLQLLAGMFLAQGELFHQPGPHALTVDTFADPFERLLRDGAVDGSLRQVDPALAATVLFNSAGWGYIHLRASHHWPPEQARSAVTDLVLGGLLPR
jgi:AcrR family transcriptional regulator